MKLCLMLSCLLFSSLSFARTESFNAGRFGKVTIYGAEKNSPKQLILFLSGDGGWNAGVVDMAKSLEDPDTVIVGVSTPAYFKNLTKSKEKCHYSAADLESLSHLVQMKYNFKEYVIPTLVGYSSGASLVYGVLVQAPTNTFRGAISLGFCPDIEADKPLCKGNGLESEAMKKPKDFMMKPYTKLKQPWVVLHGNADQVCAFAEQKKFAEGLPNTTFVELNKVGHGFSVQKNWMPQFKAAFDKIKDLDKPKIKNPAIEDLPVEELQVDQKPNDTLVVILSGDGGWASLDKDLANAFNEQGYSVVGLNSLKYFWKPKTADDIGKDLNRIALHYTKEWKKSKILWIGYSMGADALPFGLTKISSEAQKKSLAAVYIGLSKNAEFEFNFTNWLNTGSSEDGKPTKPEIVKLNSTEKSIKNICIYGSEEDDSGCEVLKDSIKVIELPGGHHFGGDYDKIASLILKSI